MCDEFCDLRLTAMDCLEGGARGALLDGAYPWREIRFSVGDLTVYLQIMASQDEPEPFVIKEVKGFPESGELLTPQGQGVHGVVFN